MNAADRHLLAVLQEPLAAELNLSDTQLGSFGLYFAVAFALASYPFAALADRGAIRTTVVGTLAAWSAFTALCGSAQGYLTFALARIGVAIGEAGVTPASHAMIAHTVPVHARASALSALALSGVAGLGMAYGLGGYLATEVGWRMTFVILGLLGLVVSPLVWLGLAPDRLRPATPVGEASGPSVREVARTFWSNRSLRLLSIGAMAAAFGGYGIAQWTASLLVRHAGFSIGQAGASMMVFGVTAAAVGAVLGGVLPDYFGRRSERAYALVPALAMAAAVPAVILMALSGSPIVMLAGFWLASCVPPLCVIPVFALVQRLATPNSRATAAATIILLINFVGMGGGPMFIGMASDGLSGAGVDAALRYAVLLAGVAFILGAICSALSAKWIGTDVASASAAAKARAS